MLGPQMLAVGRRAEGRALAGSWPGTGTGSLAGGDRVSGGIAGSAAAARRSEVEPCRVMARVADGQCGGWRRAGLLPACEGLDHDHVTAAARARCPRILERVIFGRCRDGKELASERDAIFAHGAG